MTITTTGRISFTDISDEFGLPSDLNPINKNSLGSYRISESVGSLTNLPIDRNVPRSGPIKFSDFYGKRLNIVIFYTDTNTYGGPNGVIAFSPFWWSPSTSYAGPINARTTFNNKVSYQTRVLGGYLPVPDDPTDKRIIINVNRRLGAVPNTTRSSANDANRRRCAIRTGNWSATPPASIVMEFGSGAFVYGAGGNGGNATTASNPLPTDSNGMNGSSAVGIEYPTVIVNRGYIQCGFGGGGAGGWDTYSDGERGGGGGGGGGAGAGRRFISTIPSLVTPLYSAGIGGTTVGFPVRGRGTQGEGGKDGTPNVAGRGGAGGLPSAAGAGGTGGYFTNSINGWDIRYGHYTNRRLGVGTIGGGLGNPEGLFWHPEGTYLYASGQGNFVHRFTATVPWELDTILWDGITKRADVNSLSGISYAAGLFFKPDGTRMWVASNSNNRIYQFNLTTPWDVSTSTFTTNNFLSVATQDTGLHDIWWKSDGSAVYALTNGADRVFQYNITNPANYWDLGFSPTNNATFTAGQFFDLTNKEDEPLGICFKPDGTKMYIAGQQRDRVQEFNLSTPWLINDTGNVTPTAAFSNSTHPSLYVNREDNQPRSVFIRQDNGESLYLLGSQNNRIYQYSLSAQTGEGGIPRDVLGGKSGYPGFAVVSTSTTSLTIDPTSTGTIIGLTTVGTVL